MERQKEDQKEKAENKKWKFLNPWNPNPLANLNHKRVSKNKYICVKILKKDYL